MATERSDALDLTSVPVGRRVVTGNGGLVIPEGSTRLVDVDVDDSRDEVMADTELVAVGCAVGFRLVAPLIAASVLELDIVVTLVVLATPEREVAALDKTDDSVEDEAMIETEEGPED